MTGRSYVISSPCRLIENVLNFLTLKDVLKQYINICANIRKIRLTAKNFFSHLARYGNNFLNL